MKRHHLYRICGITYLLSLFAACSPEGRQEVPAGTLYEAELRLEGAGAAPGLSTPLYLFRRPAGSGQEYVLSDLYGPVVDGETLKLPVADLMAYDYRFLMVAQPDDTEWFKLLDGAGLPLASGTAWNDLRLEAAACDVASEGYFGFADRTGESLLSGGNVRLTLGRIAGQLRFDCFRIGGSMSEPVGVVSTDVESVLDRITRIDVTYENPTVALRFGAEETLVPAAIATEPLVQTILPDLTDFRVVLPQQGKGLDILDASLRGSLRMEGAYLLPSDAQLRVTLVFTYYDTTPACSNDHTGAHTVDCFVQRKLTLRLPAADVPTGLPVAADCFTVNRAGLRCDRIIDVPLGGTIETDFGWK